MNVLPNGLSILTVTLNLFDGKRIESFLQGIDSVRAQDYSYVEHLIVDGYSTDGTQEFLAHLAGIGRISRYVSEPDKGIYDAMNKAAKLAHGEYLLFLNSDDFYHDPKALGALGRLAARRRPDFLFAPVLVKRPSGEVSEVPVSPFLARTPVNIPFCHQGLAVRHDVFKELGGFDLSMPVAADYDFILRMVFAGYRGLKFPTPFVTYRAGGASSNNAGRKRDHMAAWRKAYSSLISFTEADSEEMIRTRRMPTSLCLRVMAARGSTWAMRGVISAHLLRTVLRKARGCE
jgi:glycosyltransferase involved in cell wall biosynthesis